MKKNKLISVKCEGWILLVFTAFYVMFCNSFMIELPHLAWFDFFGLIEPFESHQLTLKQLFSAYCEHGMLGYNILFLLNVKFFHLSTLFDVYLNDVVVFLCGCIIMKEYMKCCERKEKMYYVGVIGICAGMFAATQLSSGGMETQVRLGCLFIIVVFKKISDYFLMEQPDIKTILQILLCLVLALNVFGTIYTFAGVPLLFLITLYRALKEKNKRNYNLFISLMYIFCALLYLAEYNLFGMKGYNSNQSLVSTILEVLFLHPLTMIKAILAYNGGSVLGSALYMNGSIDLRIYLFVGVFVTVSLIWALYMYCKIEMYKASYIPVLLVGYSFVVVFLTLFGREHLGWDWLLSEWYNVHSKFQIVACIWILVYSQIKMKKSPAGRIGVTNRIILCFLFLTMLIGNYTHIQRAPYVAQYYKEKQEYLFYDREDMPVDENGMTPLLADIDTTMDSIEIMKKYSLSVYNNPSMDYLLSLQE